MSVMLVLVLIFFLVCAIYIPALILKTYRLGLSDCAKVLKNEEVISEVSKESSKEPTKEEIIAMNIENYSGDGRGQIDIENDS